MPDNRIALVLTGALVGGGFVFAMMWARETPMTPPPVTMAAADDRERDSASAREPVASDLTPVLAAIDAVQQDLAALEAKVDALVAVPARVPAAVNAGPVTLDADTVLAALEAAEQRKVDGLSDGVLLQDARRLAKSGDPLAAEQRYEALLARNLPPDDRARAQTEFAMLLRSRDDAASRARSATLLQEVVDTHGLSSRAGSQAALQLVWSHAKQDDHGRGLAQADALAAAPGVTPEIRTNARWAAAIMAQSLGDVGRARHDYEALLRELGGQSGQEKLADDIRRRLAGL